MFAIALHKGEIEVPRGMNAKTDTAFSDNGGKRRVGRPAGSGARMVPAFTWGTGNAKLKAKPKARKRKRAATASTPETAPANPTQLSVIAYVVKFKSSTPLTT